MNWREHESQPGSGGEDDEGVMNDAAAVDAASVVPILRDICKWAGLTNREVTTDAPRQCQVCDFVDVKVVPARTDAPLVPGTRR